MQTTNFEHDETHHHIVPPSTYLMVLGALAIGTIVTVFAAYKDMGFWNVPVALTIATIKATLVIMFFMHVKYSSKLVQVSIIIGVAFFLLMVIGIMTDYWTRHDHVVMPPAIFPLG